MFLNKLLKLESETKKKSIGKKKKERKRKNRNGQNKKTQQDTSGMVPNSLNWSSREPHNPRRNMRSCRRMFSSACFSSAVCALGAALFSSPLGRALGNAGNATRAAAGSGGRATWCTAWMRRSKKAVRACEGGAAHGTWVAHDESKIDWSGSGNEAKDASAVASSSTGHAAGMSSKSMRTVLCSDTGACACLG